MSFYKLIKRTVSEIHFLKVLEAKAQRSPDLQKKSVFKAYKNSKICIESPEYLWQTSTNTKKIPALKQTHRNDAAYFDSEGQNCLKKHITVTTKKFISLGILLASSE